ncbi:hypothetical protein ACT8ZV_09715 [Nocardioides sp. MAHUQ-72]|uniref:hypothetical protein n=1 Tax=unclassified Nocardioides TaxID=2615069 RepID=UPI00361230B1
MDGGSAGGAPDGDRPGGRARETYAWPLVALVAVILPQVLVPSRLREGPPLIVPLVEGVVLLVLVAVAARPGPVPRAARPLVLTLIAVLIVANTSAAARLLVVIARHTPAGQEPATVTQLMVGAGIVLSTNIVTFGLCYWQLDGGGPDARQGHPRPYPDFQFPQTGTEGLAAPGWQPRFPDHLYVAFTNAVAFSPTDTLPLTHRVKALMAVQSLISVSVIGVVLSRIINILPP